MGEVVANTNVENEEDNKINIKFFCNKCQETHELSLSKKIFESQLFPVSYIYVHGDPQVVATLYIDAKYKVRGVEFSKGLSIKEDELTRILEKSKSQTLIGIPEERVFGFQLYEGDYVTRYYMKPEFKDRVNFSRLRQFKAIGHKVSLQKEDCSEFFIHYDNFWISCVCMMEYTFILIVDSSIDVARLKTQTMAIFETIMS